MSFSRGGSSSSSSSSTPGPHRLPKTTPKIIPHFDNQRKCQPIDPEQLEKQKNANIFQAKMPTGLYFESRTLTNNKNLMKNE